MPRQRPVGCSHFRNYVYLHLYALRMRPIVPEHLAKDPSVSLKIAALVGGKVKIVGPCICQRHALKEVYEKKDSRWKTPKCPAEGSCC